ncbi:GlxA family transcriptional regulator [Taibaiella koreensis]|uniref:GlxA family transcriptional regulator n=1 Tax=Taibaiella koreensis TaxID=1268548 RepID=UPI000E59C5ED|nr:helix-turn-helix domain-containing protein [Taibaiella koreensis]
MNATHKEKGAQKKQVVIVAMSSRLLIQLAGPADVFSYANSVLRGRASGGGYEIIVAAPTPDKTVKMETGLELRCQTAAMEIDYPIDTLIIAGNDFRDIQTEALTPFYQWLSTINERNTRRIASVCGGAFALAKTGLLDGRNATTHWNLGEKLQRHYPQVRVNANPFYINDGPVYTAAGVSSGIDLALALVEEDYGKDIAVEVARQLVFYLSRPGFQSQFGSLLPAYEPAGITHRLQEWVKERLHEPLAVGSMAEHLHMSVRNLTRVFRKEAGMPPAKFVEKLRVEAARKLLEDTDMPLERIAELCGLGSHVSMRRTFLRHLMTTPSDYRRAFRTALKHKTAMSGMA